MAIQIPGGYRSPYVHEIAALLARGGDIKAQGRAAQGQIWGNTVANLGSIGGEYVAQHQAEQAEKQREAALSQFIDSGEWMKDPRVALAGSIKILGPDRGMKFAGGLIGAMKISNAPTPEEAAKMLPMVARGFTAAPAALKPGLWTQAEKLMQASGILQPGATLGPYDPATHDPFIASLASEGVKGEGVIKLAPDEVAFAPGGGDKPIARGLPKVAEPKTVPLEQQLATALATGDSATYQRLLKVKRDEAIAGRDPSVASTAAGTRDLSRLDESYKWSASELERTAKPLTDQAERFNRLVATVDEHTPQADALVAPELLTVMAGGAGSGLRMNEAEIARIVGGRSNFETLKAKLNKWSADPSQALTITEAQRTQIKSLLAAAASRMEERVTIINDSRTRLRKAKSVDEHREIIDDLKRGVTKVNVPETPAASHETPKPKSKAEFDALASGTLYLDPLGNMRRKP